MADESYESECNRAELLGLQAPSKNEWQSSNQANKIDSNDISEESKAQEPQPGESSEPKSMIDELNSKLSLTYVHLDKFKKACGSLTNLLKIRGGEGENADIPSDGTDGADVGIGQDLEKLQ